MTFVLGVLHNIMKVSVREDQLNTMKVSVREDQLIIPIVILVTSSSTHAPIAHLHKSSQQFCFYNVAVACCGLIDVMPLFYAEAWSDIGLIVSPLYI